MTVVEYDDTVAGEDDLTVEGIGVVGVLDQLC